MGGAKVKVESFSWREFAAGSVAGACGVFVGHPLDTVKTRAQTSSPASGSPWRLAGSMSSAEGARSFYRGLSGPMLSKSAEQALIFGLNQEFRRVLPLEGDALAVASGALAGLVGMGILTPVYVAKVQLQLPPSESLATFRGPLHCLRWNYARQGLRGLYAGLLASCAANPISYGVRFYSYGKLVPALGAAGLGLSERQAQLVGGGIAGVLTWASSYPLDVVMSRMQAHAALSRHGGTFRPLRWHFCEILRESGPLGFFRGLGPCLLRAFPVNAVIFVSYEQAMAVL